jgi:hypothetical protein
VFEIVGLTDAAHEALLKRATHPAPRRVQKTSIKPPPDVRRMPAASKLQLHGQNRRFLEDLCTISSRNCRFCPKWVENLPETVDFVQIEMIFDNGGPAQKSTNSSLMMTMLEK